MCGIVGALGTLSANELDHMLESIKHRGPDNTGVFSNGNVHLGHVRLSIVDVNPSSDQPLWDASDRACIIFNGEIYNFKDLRLLLLEKGYKFKSNGDAEVLLNLYLEFGEKSLDMIEGMYAFAVWDSHDNSLFIARDPYGIKPLYYLKNSSGFYFASEIKALTQLSSFEVDIEYDALFRSLVFLWSPGESTIFKNVKKLKPGHYLKMTNFDGFEQVCFDNWPNYSPNDKPVADIITSLNHTIKCAVESQMVADVPVGAFLSGGLDSSIIVVHAQKTVKKRLDCFTIDTGADSNEFDRDLPFAQQVVSLTDSALHIKHTLPITREELRKVVYHLEELHADPAAFNTLEISKSASDSGIKVLLSGTGGDDIFSGYRRHKAAQIQNYIDYIPTSLWKATLGILNKVAKRHSITRRLSKLLRYQSYKSDERLLSYFYWVDPKTIFGLFNDNVKQKISLSPMDFILDDLKSQKIVNDLEKMLYLEKKYFLPDHNLAYTDKMSMAESIEVRVPLLDKRLVKLAATIRTGLKQKFGKGKWILKLAATKFLPKHIVFRKKSGFGAPMRAWIDGDLAELVHEYLSTEKIIKRGIFKPEKIEELLDKQKSHEEDYAYLIYALINFEIWCEIFLDPKPEPARVKL